MLGLSRFAVEDAVGRDVVLPDKFLGIAAKFGRAGIAGGTFRRAGTGGASRVAAGTDGERGAVGSSHAGGGWLSIRPALSNNKHRQLVILRSQFGILWLGAEIGLSLNISKCELMQLMA